MSENVDLEQVKKELNEFLNNQENKEQAVLLAHQIKEEISTEWFELKKLIKKFKLTEQQAYTRMTILCAFNLAAKDVRGAVQKYKIDFDRTTQRQLLIDEITFHESQVAILKQRLSKLN